MDGPSLGKVMTARDAVQRFIFDGCSIGMGGQNLGRVPMALTHEIVRQGKQRLTLMGCNLSIGMDILVGAGLVSRTEAGTGNLERFGTTFRWRYAIEEGRLEHRDYSHLAMVSRFLAGEMGLPFMPIKSLLGSDILANHPESEKTAAIIENPWNPQEPVVLLPAATPDVAIIHVQRADEMGNVVIEGFAAHELEMVRAANAVIVSCDELTKSEDTRRSPERTTIPYIHISAVVEQPFGAHPTSVYRYYDFDGGHITDYQSCARVGGQAYQEYLDHYIRGCETFEDYLELVGGVKKLHGLRQAMLRML